jgi:hypothetical protein
LWGFAKVEATARFWREEHLTSANDFMPGNAHGHAIMTPAVISNG